MKMYIIKGLEMWGCPLEIMILAKTKNIAIKKLIEKYPQNKELILDGIKAGQVTIEEVEDGYYEASIG